MLKDKAKISAILKKFGWLSINQLCIEVRLMEAWKSINDKRSQLNDLLRIRENNSYVNRSSVNFQLVPEEPSRLTDNRFVNLTSKAWRNGPKHIKSAKTLQNTRKLIRALVLTLPL